MCNRKDEGGRCHAHLVQAIQGLNKREEQSVYDSAVKSGVPLDKEALKSQLEAELASCEQEKEDYRAEVAQKKADMLALHEVAGKELKKSLAVHDADHGRGTGTFIANPFSKDDADGNPKPNPEDLPGFAGYEDTQAYLESHRFAVAVFTEKKKVVANRERAKEDFEKKLDKDLVKGNIELRALKRKILMADVKDFVHGGQTSSESYNLENSYDEALKLERQRSGITFDGSEEGKQYNQRIETLDSEYMEAEDRRTKMVAALHAHWNKTPSISLNARGSHPREIGRMEITQPGDYARLKGNHYAWRFRKAKEEYVKAVDSEPKWGARQDKVARDLKKNPPLQKEAFESYRKNIYPTTPEAKEIKGLRDEARKELVLTPTYRNNLRKKIDYMYYNGHSVIEERKVLLKLDEAAGAKANARKAGLIGSGRVKQDANLLSYDILDRL